MTVSKNFNQSQPSIVPVKRKSAAAQSQSRKSNAQAQPPSTSSSANKFRQGARNTGLPLQEGRPTSSIGKYNKSKTNTTNSASAFGKSLNGKERQIQNAESLTGRRSSSKSVGFDLSVIGSSVTSVKGLANGSDNQLLREKKFKSKASTVSRPRRGRLETLATIEAPKRTFSIPKATPVSIEVESPGVSGEYAILKHASKRATELLKERCGFHRKRLTSPTESITSNGESGSRASTRGGQMENEPEKIRGTLEDIIKRFRSTPRASLGNRRLTSSTGVRDESAKDRDRELLKALMANEFYRGIQITTRGELHSVNARRLWLRDAYAIGRSILLPPFHHEGHGKVDHPHLMEEIVNGYKAFRQRIEDIHHTNYVSCTDLQIVCIFTASPASKTDTSNIETQRIEQAMKVMKCFLKPEGYLLWVRCGSPDEWKDPNNPFRTDKEILLETLPTAKVWGTAKRVAGSRLFKMENLITLLED